MGLLFSILILLLLVAAYAWWLEPARLRIRHERVESQDPALRVLLLTDLHLGRFTSAQRILRFLSQIGPCLKDHRVDLVLLGGDYLDHDPAYVPDLRRVLPVIKAWGMPVYAVPGNHDYRACRPLDPIADAFAANGIELLRNRSVHVGAWRIAGLDDLEESFQYHQALTYSTNRQYQTAAQRLDWYSKLAAAATPTLLLTHNPDGVYLAGPQPVAVLAGHTHGGQVAPVDWIGRTVPRLIHAILPAGSFRTRAGRFSVGGTPVIVSRGLGGSHVPARLARRPEAVIISLGRDV